MKLTIFTLLVLFASITALAQNEPTREETIEWLKENLPTKATYTARRGQIAYADIVQDVAFDDCVCKMTTLFISKTKSVNNTMTSKYSFSFANIDSASIKVITQTDLNPTRFNLLLFTVGYRKTVAKEFDSGIGRPSETTLHTDMVEIGFDDKSTVERFVRAFKRLITLCQARKKEPF